VRDNPAAFEEWLSGWLVDPAAMIWATPPCRLGRGYGGIIMLNQNLTTQEIQAVIAYLRTL
jgi:hypothetical protein